jgi:hypothetical protein
VVEQAAVNRLVAGSSPARGAKFSKGLDAGRLALFLDSVRPRYGNQRRWPALAKDGDREVELEAAIEKISARDLGGRADTAEASARNSVFDWPTNTPEQTVAIICQPTK